MYGSVYGKLAQVSAELHLQQLKVEKSISLRKHCLSIDIEQGKNTGAHTLNMLMFKSPLIWHRHISHKMKLLKTISVNRCLDETIMCLMIIQQ